MPDVLACQVEPLKKSIVPCSPPAHTALALVPHTARRWCVALLIIFVQPEGLQRALAQPFGQLTN